MMLRAGIEHMIIRMKDKAHLNTLSKQVWCYNKSSFGTCMFACNTPSIAPEP